MALPRAAVAVIRLPSSLKDAILDFTVLGGVTMPTSQINPGGRSRPQPARGTAARKVTPIKPAQPKPWISEFLRRRDALHKALEAEGKKLG